MITRTLSALRELSWRDARDLLMPTNSELVSIIDKLSPGKNLVLYEVTYPFGASIINDGLFYLPNSEGKLVPIDDASIDPAIRDALNYNVSSNPAGIMLENSAELFMTFESTIVPYTLMTPGMLFGLWRIFDAQDNHHPISVWNMVSGARSLFMLPKISNNVLYAKLMKKYRLVNEAPKDIMDHWLVFHALAQRMPATWNSKILFFSKTWFEKINDEAWLPLKCYFYQELWKGSSFNRNKFLWNLTISRLLTMKNYKFDPYIVEIVKHLFAIGVGAAPAFAPATSNLTGPIEELIAIYLNDYQLKNYSPVILQPAYLDKQTREPVYYFLNHPTSLEFSPTQRINNLADTYQCWSLLDKCIKGFQIEKLNIEQTAIHAMLNEVQFDFYHIHAENYSSIRDPKFIPLEDSRFIDSRYPDNLQFPDKNALLHGCIKISFKNKT